MTSGVRWGVFVWVMGILLGILLGAAAVGEGWLPW